MKQSWFVYMVRCSDDSLYTGITTDVARRVIEHNSPINGARYTRSRQPVVLVYREKHKNRSEASQRECQIKKLPRASKELLMQ